MTKTLHRWCGWLACFLGLLLAAQLAQAAPCVSGSDGKAAVSHAAMQPPCAMQGASSDACAVNGERIHAGATAPLPPEVPSSAGLPDPRAPVARAGFERVSFVGPSPGFRLPLHILFHRYLI